MKRERIAFILGATLLAAPVFAQAPPAPTLTSPAGNGASDPPTFVWNAAAGATQYYLWLNNGAGQAIVQTFHDASTACAGATCITTLASPLGEGSYTWWIQASNASGPSPWSSALTFAVGQPPAAPVLVSPNGSGTADPPTFTWNAAAGASEYYLWVNNGSGTPVVQSHHGSATACVASTCSVSLGAALGEGTYTWWVQGKNAVGDGPWSSSQTFAVGQAPGTPALTAPSGYGATSPVTFTWGEVSTAAQYYLWVNDGAGQPIVQSYHSSATVCAAGVCSVTPVINLGQGSYTWWVQASNAVGPGPWSAALNFAIGQPPGAPSLVSPSGYGFTSPTSFTWNEVSDATQYYLWVNDGTGRPIVQTFHNAAAVCASGTCTVTPTATFVQGTYTWWVQAINAVGPGPWSAASSFAIGTPPGVASLLSPSGPGASNPAVFVWNAVADASDYELWVNGPSGSVLIHTYHSASTVCDAATCTVATATTLAQGSYVWWVRASNGAGPGAWSAAQSFAIGLPPGTPSLISPEGAQGSRPTYIWAAVPGASSYYLWVNGPAGTPVTQLTISSADVCGVDDYCTATPPGHLSNGAHTWWVQAGNAVGPGPWSASKTFDARAGEASRLGAGANHSLAITPQGNQFGFGGNGFGQLGDGSTTDRIVPTPAFSMSNLIGSSAGGSFSLATTASGGVYAFGANSLGQLGDGTLADNPTPSLVPGITMATSVAAGSAHALVLLADGTVRVFGRNTEGQLGDGSSASSSTPLPLALADVVGVAAGDQHSLAVTRSGSVLAWGSAGRLGNVGGSASPTPLAIATITDGIAVAAGLDHSLVLRANGEVLGFGLNGSGQLGDGTATDRLTPVTVGPSGSPLQGAEAIAAGAAHSLILKGDGTLWAMGDGGRGQLGQGDTNASWLPVQVGVPVRVVAVAAGAFHSLALDVEGGLWVWGANESGQLGDGTTVDRLSPVRIADALMTFRAGLPSMSPGGGTFSNAVSISLSSATPGAVVHYTVDGSEPTAASPTGALNLDGGPTVVKARAFHSAYNSSATVSVVFMFEASAPQMTPDGLFVPPFAVTLSSTTAGATVRYTTDGSTPTPSSPIYTVPIPLSDNTTIRAQAFKSGYAASPVTTGVYTLGVVNTLTLSVPGGRYITRRDVVATTNTPGATIRFTTNGAEPTESDAAAPGNGLIVVDRSMVLRVKAFKAGLTPSAEVRASYLITGQVAGGQLQTMFLKANGELWMSGANYNGQIGDGGSTGSVRMSPVLVLSGVIQVAAGQLFSVALKADGTVWTWGESQSGRLGRSTATVPASLPGQVDLGGVSAVAIAAGSSHTLAVLSTGQVRSWGLNLSGELGCTGCPTSAAAPVTVVLATGGAVTGVTSVAAGNGHSMALRSDGTVLGWGANSSGSVGDGTTTTRPTAVPLPTLTNVTAIATQGLASYALVGAAGDLKAWGANSNGQLGLGSTTNQNTPTQVVTGVRDIAAGGSHLVFTTAKARLWGAGLNSSRELGDATTTQRTTATRSRVSREVVTIGEGLNYSLAAATDGVVWGTGNNANGQLGLGNLTSPLAPAPMPAFALFDGTDLEADIDGDGLNLFEEFLAGTDPLVADSNGDGMLDSVEFALGLSTAGVDTDGDGVSNAAEILAGTDPFNADTDGDGFSDGVDQFPLDATRHALAPTPGDTTPPVITLLKPSGAVIIP